MRKLLFAISFCCALVLLSATHSLKATKYHPGRGGAGWVTASGERIDNYRLKRYEIKWVALSHDMFRNHGYRLGDTIMVTCERVPNLNGKWVVKDKMGPRLRNRIDFLLPLGDTIGFSTTTVEIEKL
ncbi:MAG: hypothetical protein J6X81_01415 [Muribaculaceae bacterium]|nr:hypothetical protein [Muribaculaceae bacterium]